MERAKILRSLIEETGLSIKAFSAKADIPYTTLRSILDRGIGNASVDNVMKICKTIGITVEELDSMVSGEARSQREASTIAAHLDGVDLTADEEEDLNKYIDFLLSRRKK
ncbi:helix-turn-helix domain-containing protein [Alkaliphilus metalliredigens]|uniref:helix-turn-helix domain-containing protein n=1 Tax=Alkaliphilus metalliredigens TaxID=208226 RepID=UPI0002ECC95C|nr:helix-turn-helix transcriptional regulator [Alkaliphilus metalliredigens]